MVKERKLAIPFQTVYITQLPKETQEIIRSDMERYAREHGIILGWDAEAKDYVGMTRRFCDIDEIYLGTKLTFCGPGEDIKAFESSQQRNVTLKLSDGDIDALCRKTAQLNISVSQLLENFISDLLGTNRGKDHSGEAFAVCWFDWWKEITEPKDTFLIYLIEYDHEYYAVECWENIELCKKSDSLDDKDKVSLQYYQKKLDLLFEEYKRLYPNASDKSVEEGMAKVIEYVRERDNLLNVSRSDRARENNR